MTLVIVGPGKTAYDQLRRMCASSEGDVQKKGDGEAIVDGCHVIALGDGEGDVCKLVSLGLRVKIHTVQEDGISLAMRKRINLIRTSVVY